MMRITCTKDNPKPHNDQGYWVHPDAIQSAKGMYVINNVSGDYIVYRCPHCHYAFGVYEPLVNRDTVR